MSELYEAIQKIDGALEVKKLSDRRAIISLPRDKYREAVRRLAGSGFAHVIAMTGVDMKESIDLLLHLGTSTMVTLRVRLDPADPKVPTISDILPGAELREREVHDLLGVEFIGHPSQERFMVPEDWPEGIFPLRKSYSPSTPAPRRLQK